MMHRQYRWSALIVVMSGCLLAPAMAQEQNQQSEPSPDQTTEQLPAEETPAQPSESGDAGSDSEAATATEEPAEAADTRQEGADDQRTVRRLGDFDSGSDWSMDIPTGLQVRVSPEDLDIVTTPDEALNNRLLEVMTNLAINPEDQQALAQLEQIKQTVVSRINTALSNRDIGPAGAYINVLQELDGGHAALPAATQRLQQLRQLQELNTFFTEAITDQRLLQPAENNARAILLQMQELTAESEEPDPVVADAEATLQQNLLQGFRESLDTQAFEEAATYLDAAEQLPGEFDVTARREQLAESRRTAMDQLATVIAQAIDNGELERAEQQLTELIALGAPEQQIGLLRARLEDARLYGNFIPGQVFRDEFGIGTESGPPMIVLPAGSFMMGSPDTEPGHRSNEEPYHRVTFERGFALSQHEITVDEFRAFVRATGYRAVAEREGGSTVYDEETGRMMEANVNWRHDYAGNPASANMPVMHVSWLDAQAYVDWLSRVTDRNYRLPSEAELEYAIRGGTRSVYWWGDGSPDNDNVENVAGSGDRTRSRRQWTESFSNYTDGFWGPAPVGSLQPNPYGLFDINGNLKEWSADCWHVNYNRAPTDGSAWINPGCESRVVRGADWSSTPDLSRSALRLSARESTRGVRVGIRIARDL